MPIADDFKSIAAGLAKLEGRAPVDSTPVRFKSGDKAFAEWNILLDGVPQREVWEADREEGWVDVTMRDGKGRRIYTEDGKKIARERRKGVVQFVRSFTGGVIDAGIFKGPVFGDSMLGEYDHTRAILSAPPRIPVGAFITEKQPEGVVTHNGKPIGAVYSINITVDNPLADFRGSAKTRSVRADGGEASGFGPAVTISDEDLKIDHPVLDKLRAQIIEETERRVEALQRLVFGGSSALSSRKKMR